MSKTKVTLNLSPPLTLIRAEAAAMGVSFPALLTADAVRFRRLADAAVPPLTKWQWGLLSHVLDGIEAHRILVGDDSLPSAGFIIAEIDIWADGALDDETLRAGELRQQILSWSALTIAGVLIHLRAENARKLDFPR
jgi:hypothetical protein